LKTLGKGGYATVKLCINLDKLENWAMKSMSKKFLKSKFPTGGKKSALEFVKEELAVLKTLEHPNVIYLHEIIDDITRDHIYLITQYHSKGSLADKLEDKNKEYIKHN
jgi:[calcium/calmodulin-dependent protein kinase] kinase